MRFLSSPPRTYNTHFAIGHESPIARRTVVPAAATDPLATSPYALSQQSTSYLQYSLCDRTRISNRTKNGSTSSRHRSTCDLTVCAFSAVRLVPTILTLRSDTNLQSHEER